MTINEIKKKQEDSLSAIFENLGIFFAFSDEQFEESRKPDVEYFTPGFGMVIPVQNKDAFKIAYDQHCQETEALYREHIPMDDYILYELYNHEAYYTWDVTSAMDAVQVIYSECTREDMWRVFDENKKSE